MRNKRSIPSWGALGVSAFMHAAVGAAVITQGLNNEKPSYDQDFVHVSLEPPVVRLAGAITKDSAHKFIDTFNALSRSILGQTTGVVVSFESPGGSVDAGYEIMSAIQNSDTNVTFACDGQVGSMAAIILAGTQDQNVIAENGCEIVVHAPFFRYEDQDFQYSLKHAEIALMAQEIDYLDQWVLEDEAGRGTQRVLSHAQVLKIIQEHNDSVDRFIQMISDNSKLTPDDVRYMLNQGDVTIEPMAAYFLGIVNGIRGAHWDGLDELVTKLYVCDEQRLPFLSLCND